MSGIQIAMLNLLISDIPYKDDLAERIVNELDKRVNLNHTIIYNRSGKSPISDRIEYRRSDPLNHHFCKEFEESDLPVDNHILELMLPYKSSAMQILMRNGHRDVYERNYSEKVYYIILRYWYNVLLMDKIDCVIFLLFPHWVGEYILYCLAQVMNIKTILVYTQIGGNRNDNDILYSLGTSMNRIGYNVQSMYNNDKSVYKWEDLSSFIQDAVQNVKKRAVMMSFKKDDLIKEITKEMLSGQSLRRILHNLHEVFSMKYGKSRINTSETELYFKKQELKYRLKARFKEHSADKLKDYKKLSEKPDYSQRYIYFPLQQTPEASTMPLAGESKNQIFNIESLAYIGSKFDIKIYVKEHWGQVHREHGFYKNLAKIQNVVLIDIDENSIELTEKSFFVATQTGNCLFEAFILDKPAIAFGCGYTFKGMPNIYQVESLKDISNAINKELRNSYSIVKSDKIKYLKALGDQMILLQLQDGEREGISKQDVVEKFAIFVGNAINNMEYV